jgi:DNA-binding MarR family transcriptional regulator
MFNCGAASVEQHLQIVHHIAIYFVQPYNYSKNLLHVLQSDHVRDYGFTAGRGLMNQSSDTPSKSDDEKNSQDSSVSQAYGVLCDIRDTITKGLNARLSAAGFSDLTGDDLLTLAAMNLHRSAARELIRQVGITSQMASQSVKKMILHGYVGFHDNPDKPRQSALIVTKRGRAVFEQIQDARRGGVSS